jgi:hypothetical protein
LPNEHKKGDNKPETVPSKAKAASEPHKEANTPKEGSKTQAKGEKAKAQEAKPAPLQPSPKTDEELDFEKAVNEHQRAFIANTMNADKFFKFHAKYGSMNVLLRAVGGLFFMLVALMFLSSYHRQLAFYEQNRLSEDHWSNAPSLARFGGGD